MYISNGDHIDEIGLRMVLTKGSSHSSEAFDVFHLRRAEYFFSDQLRRAIYD